MNQTWIQASSTWLGSARLPPCSQLYLNLQYPTEQTNPRIRTGVVVLVGNLEKSRSGACRLQRKDNDEGDQHEEIN